MLTVKYVLEGIGRVARKKGYNTTIYNNHLLIERDESKIDITIIDDIVIIIQKGHTKVINVFELVNKTGKDLAEFLKL